MSKNTQSAKTVLATSDNFNEEAYLAFNSDVAGAVSEGIIKSGRHHFELYGRDEKRRMFEPTLYFKIKTILMPQFIKAFLRGASRRRINLLSTQKRLTELESRLNDMQILLDQLQSMLQFKHGLCALPPKHLQVRVVGSYTPDFIRSGFSSIYPDLNNALNTAGKKLEDFKNILDFGCGCGRAIIALGKILPDAVLHGTDIDDEAIKWLKENYSNLAEFSVAPHYPPTVYRDETFDFIFGISVFTHLPEDMQFKWLVELKRIMKTGGYAIMTIHGEKHYGQLSGNDSETMSNKGFLYIDSGYGERIALPEFYQTAFHSPDYIKREWGKYFEVVNIYPLAMQKHQDIVLLKKQPSQ